MEKMNVFGKQSMKFDTKDGNHIEGIKLHCTKESSSEYIQGKAYEGIFISTKSDMHKLAYDLPVGSVIDVSFNRYGKADSFTVLK